MAEFVLYMLLVLGCVMFVSSVIFAYIKDARYQAKLKKQQRERREKLRQ